MAAGQALTAPLLCSGPCPRRTVRCLFFPLLAPIRVGWHRLSGAALGLFALKACHLLGALALGVFLHLPPIAGGETRIASSLPYLGCENCQVDRDIAIESWLRIFEQGDKWNLGLTAGMICLRIRSDDEETSPPEPHSGIQG